MFSEEQKRNNKHLVEKHVKNLDSDIGQVYKRYLKKQKPFYKTMGRNKKK